MAEGSEGGPERSADTGQVAPAEQEAEVTAKPISLDFTDTSVRVYGDVDTIRQRLRAEEINFAGAEIDGCLSFGKKIESRIDELFSGSKRNRKGVKVLDRADILDLLGHGDKPLHLVESAVQKKENGEVKHKGMTPKQKLAIVA